VRIDADAGVGVGSTRDQRLREMADVELLPLRRRRRPAAGEAAGMRWRRRESKTEKRPRRGSFMLQPAGIPRRP
jgi:hypothetical protein